MELKKVGVWSLAKITTIFGIIMGIVTIILVAVTNRALQNIPAEDLQAIGISVTELTSSSVIWTIISSGITGLIAGLVVALIYNLLAKYMGGIKLVLADKK